MYTPPTTIYSAHVLEDSISPAGKRLTTFVLTYPRAIHSEFMTHRVLSKNSESSRARPVITVLKKVMEHPYLPEKVGKNKSGMQASEYFDDETLLAFHEQLLVQRDRAVIGAFENLMSRGTVIDTLGFENYQKYLINGFGDESGRAFDTLSVLYKDLVEREKEGLWGGSPSEFFNPHKQTVNRYLEPYMWHTVIATGTEWGNYFGLRLDENADPAIQRISQLMYEAMHSSLPRPLAEGEWHAPFLQPEERVGLEENLPFWLGVTAGRCGRVSYLNHFGQRDPQKDYDLAASLLANGHMSPFEHIARPLADPKEQSGNLRGWAQLRKFIPDEGDFSQRDEKVSYQLTRK